MPGAGYKFFVIPTTSTFAYTSSIEAVRHNNIENHFYYRYTGSAYSHSPQGRKGFKYDYFPLQMLLAYSGSDIEGLLKYIAENPALLSRYCFHIDTYLRMQFHCIAHYCTMVPVRVNNHLWTLERARVYLFLDSNYQEIGEIAISEISGQVLHFHYQILTGDHLWYTASPAEDSSSSGSATLQALSEEGELSSSFTIKQAPPPPMQGFMLDDDEYAKITGSSASKPPHSNMLKLLLREMSVHW